MGDDQHWRDRMARDEYRCNMVREKPTKKKKSDRQRRWKEKTKMPTDVTICFYICMSEGGEERRRGVSDGEVEGNCWCMTENNVWEHGLKE